MDHILENTLSIETLRVESSHEEVSSAKDKPIRPIQIPSPEPETPEEGFQPSDFPSFEDELFRISWKYLKSMNNIEIHSDFHI